MVMVMCGAGEQTERLKSSVQHTSSPTRQTHSTAAKTGRTTRRYVSPRWLALKATCAQKRPRSENAIKYSSSPVSAPIVKNG